MHKWFWKQDGFDGLKVARAWWEKENCPRIGSSLMRHKIQNKNDEVRQNEAVLDSLIARPDKK